eukprot:TRINITY_DN4199_c0_g3_i1.p1 TRINITY_DN4199_c0_g3~~TRINITY_DN4199_c0_g3_i1.p1  ORF type:complete len:416 (-),score=36.57 TRINITY_DN4199_c0_g3_i1:441-1598(-)
MAAEQEPEMMRVPLEDLCLQVKILLPGGAASILNQALTPPSREALSAALRNLRDIQALSPTEDVTPLGRHLARLPVDVRVGKMLLFGCVLRCLSPILTVAAAMSARSPFVSPMDRREDANASRQRFGGASKSDHLAIARAFDGWVEARAQGRAHERQYLETNFLSRESLITIEASRADFVKALSVLGFASSDYNRGSRSAGKASGPHSLDTNAQNGRVVKAVICAGLYPHIVRVQHPKTLYVQQVGGAVAQDAAAHEIRFYTREDGRVFIHPGSVNFSARRFDSVWLAYGEKVKTSKVFVRESSMVPTYALLLFGGAIEVEHERQIVRVDQWMEFQAPARIAVLVKELRGRVDEALLQKIEDASLDISRFPVMLAVVQLLATDGF